MPANLIERLHPGPGDQGGTWLVESDMSVGPNAADEELYASGFGNLPFVSVALRIEVGGVAVQQMGILWLIVEFIYIFGESMKRGAQT